MLLDNFVDTGTTNISLQMKTFVFTPLIGRQPSRLAAIFACLVDTEILSINHRNIH
jgi:hypothetical protein